MNRRLYLKTISAIGLIGIGSYSFFKWIDSSIDIKYLFDKRELLAELVEIIIPKTDTPGAREANVHDYIISLIVNCNTEKQQVRFLSGILDLEKYTMTLYDKEFLKCNKIEKDNVVKHFSDHARYANFYLNKINNKLFGESFYSMLKELTVQGYCGSRLGATEGLNYDYIPGNYQSCIVLQQNQKSWATK